MSQIYKTLERFGLTENETLVYIEALKQPKLTPHLIHKLTKIPRTTVYDTLLSLSFKHLVELEQSDGFTKQQTIVTAKNPTVLRKMVRDKKEDLDELEIDILDILPELTGKFSKYESNTSFSYYPGIEGFKKVYYERDVYPEIVWNPIIASDIPGRDEHRKIIDDLTKTASTAKLPSRELIPLNKWTLHVLSLQYSRNKSFLNRNFRFIDNSTFDINTYISLTRNRVAMACAHNDEVWALVIKSKALYSTMKASFELLWMQAKPVTEEFIKSLPENDLLKASKRKKLKDI